MEDLAGEVLRRLAVDDAEPCRALALRKRISCSGAHDCVVFLQVHVKTGNTPTFILYGHEICPAVCTTVLESAAELFRVSCHGKASQSVVVDLVYASPVPQVAPIPTSYRVKDCFSLTTLFTAKAEPSKQFQNVKLDAGNHQLSPLRDVICDWVRLLLVPVQPYKRRE